MLDANSSTPVNAANSTEGPSRCSESSTCSALSSLRKGAPRTDASPRASSSAAGYTTSTLPSTAATCERTRCVTSSTKDCTALSESSSLSLAAMAGAVMAGCLVATVKCSNWISTKLRA